MMPIEVIAIIDEKFTFFHLPEILNKSKVFKPKTAKIAIEKSIR